MTSPTETTIGEQTSYHNTRDASASNQESVETQTEIHALETESDNRNNTNPEINEGDTYTTEEANHSENLLKKTKKFFTKMYRFGSNTTFRIKNLFSTNCNKLIQLCSKHIEKQQLIQDSAKQAELASTLTGVLGISNENASVLAHAVNDCYNTNPVFAANVKELDRMLVSGQFGSTFDFIFGSTTLPVVNRTSSKHDEKVNVRFLINDNEKVNVDISINPVEVTLFVNEDESVSADISVRDQDKSEIVHL